MPPKKIACEVCGADRSKSGKPFDGPGLLKHMTMVHGSGGAGAANATPLSCDICGATQSNRGKPFLTAANVLQHKAKQHPGANDHAAGASPAGKPGKSRRSKEPAAARGRAHHVRFCPQCGCNLEVVHAAMAFVNGEDQP
jgi:hypothetical protein